jgi:hypothetical protein
MSERVSLAEATPTTVERCRCPSGAILIPFQFRTAECRFITHIERLRAKIPVSARLAAESGVQKAPISATTAKLLIPLPDRLSRAKNPVRPMIVGVSTAVSAKWSGPLAVVALGVP